MGNIVLVGAGGTGMSGVAGLLHDLGYTNIVCIDDFQSELTDKLEKKGLKVIIGHSTYEPKLDDAIIYSEAVAGSPIIIKAKNLAHEQKKMTLIMNYFQFLGEISKYFTTVGFAGTNGKSSTTAMAIATAKNEIGIGILGAMVPELNNQSYYLNPKNISEIKSIFDFMLTGKNNKSKIVPPDKEGGSPGGRKGGLSTTLIKKYYFFVEACEYKRHFLNLDLDYTIITSLELDHTDYYKDMDDYLDAFNTLIARTKQKVFIPENIFLPLEGGLGGVSQMIHVPVEKIKFNHIRGENNNINGSLVLALLNNLESKIKNLESKIVDFKGLRRRMELLGENQNGAKIYTDYGHMASSIDAGYKALKEKYPNKKLSVIFQPHQINRILLGRKDFIKAIKQYDNILIYDIYAARENIAELVKKFQSIHAGLNESMNLGDLGAIFAEACGGKYIEDIKEIVREIENTGDDTVIGIFSAGDIDYKIRNSKILTF